MIIRLSILSIIILTCGVFCKTGDSIKNNDNDSLDSLDLIINTLKQEKDSLVKIESDLYSKLTSYKPKSPAGFSINYKSAVYGVGNILFAENHRFKFDGGAFQSLLRYNISDDYKIYFVDLYGNWKLVNETLILHATLAAGKKFIKNDSWGACFNEIVDTTILLNWTEIVFNSMGRKDKPLSKDKSRILSDNIINTQVINEDSLSGDYSYISVRKITEKDIVNIPKEKFRIMRNEIFARYGYQFKDPSLDKYFITKVWYKKKYFDCDLTKYLNDIENYNIDFIKKHEND